MFSALWSEDPFLSEQCCPADSVQHVRNFDPWPGSLPACSNVQAYDQPGYAWRPQPRSHDILTMEAWFKQLCVSHG